MRNYLGPLLLVLAMLLVLSGAVASFKQDIQQIKSFVHQISQ